MIMHTRYKFNVKQLHKRLHNNEKVSSWNSFDYCHTIAAAAAGGSNATTAITSVRLKRRSHLKRKGHFERQGAMKVACINMYWVISTSSSTVKWYICLVLPRHKFYMTQKANIALSFSLCRPIHAYFNNIFVYVSVYLLRQDLICTFIDSPLVAAVLRAPSCGPADRTVLAILLAAQRTRTLRCISNTLDLMLKYFDCETINRTYCQ